VFHSAIRNPQFEIRNPKSAIPAYPTTFPLHCSAVGIKLRSET